MWLSPDPTLVERRVMIAMSHRAALEDAFAAGATRLLVLEDECLLLADAAALLPPILTEWCSTGMGLLYLGGATLDRPLANVEGCPHLRHVDVHGCFAVGYSRPAMQRLLTEMPAKPPQMSDWIGFQGLFDNYFASQPDRVLSNPKLATSLHLLPYEEPAFRERYLP